MFIEKDWPTFLHVSMLIILSLLMGVLSIYLTLLITSHMVATCSLRVHQDCNTINSFHCADKDKSVADDNTYFSHIWSYCSCWFTCIIKNNINNSNFSLLSSLFVIHMPASRWLELPFLDATLSVLHILQLSCGCYYSRSLISIW